LSPCGNQDIDCIDCCGREVCDLSEFYEGIDVIEELKIALKETMGIDIDEWKSRFG